MKYNNIREEELKNKVGADWFKQFDTTEILGNIDFTVFPKQDNIIWNQRHFYGQKLKLEILTFQLCLCNSF